MTTASLTRNPRNRWVLRTLALTCGLLLSLTACGSKSKVGDKSLLNFKEKSQEQLGQVTTTTTAPATGDANGGKAGVTLAAAPHPKTTAAPRTATTVAATVDIAINNDNAASAFDPSEVKAAVGTIVTWVNHDTVARSVKSDDGAAFTSPSIPPGGSWSYTATKAGSFNYHDGTRPYAVAVLEIVA
jgi:plastocyanin